MAYRFCSLDFLTRRPQRLISVLLLTIVTMSYINSEYINCSGCELARWPPLARLHRWLLQLAIPGTLFAMLCASWTFREIRITCIGINRLFVIFSPGPGRLWCINDSSFQRIEYRFVENEACPLRIVTRCLKNWIVGRARCRWNLVSWVPIVGFTTDEEAFRNLSICWRAALTLIYFIH